MKEKGFSLLEVLIALTILAIGITAFLGFIKQALGIAQRDVKTSRMIRAFESNWFEMETGLHPDWLVYGSDLSSGDYQLNIENQNSHLMFHRVKAQISEALGRESLVFNVLLMEKPQ